MPSNADRLEGWVPLVLVALSGFVLALLSAFVPRPAGVALLAAAMFGAVAAAVLVARRQNSVFRALLAALGPAAGAGIAGVLLAPESLREVHYHLGSGLGLGVCAALAGFALGAAHARVDDGAPVPGRRDLVGFVTLLVVGAALVAVTAPYAAVHVPRFGA